VGDIHCKRADIEKFMQSTAPSSLAIRDLVIDLIKIRDADIVKLIDVV